MTCFDLGWGIRMGSSGVELIDAWRESARAPDGSWVLEQDRDALRDSPKVCVEWDSYVNDEQLGCPDDARLHLGLMPIPYMGDVRSASVYVLLLNPGLGPHDYFTERHQPGLTAALRSNLRQDMVAGGYPFVCLDPTYAWHGGFSWWNSRLLPIMRAMEQCSNVPLPDARQQLASRLAVIEAVPYHSVTGRHARQLLPDLPSSRLAKAFVHDHVMARVRAGADVVVVLRAAGFWDLPEVDGVVRVEPKNTRSVRFAVESPHGKRICAALGCSASDAENRSRSR